MILHYIPKDQLRSHWNFIKHGLEIVRSKGHPEWIVEDVYRDWETDRKSTRLNSSHSAKSRMPSSA